MDLFSQNSEKPSVRKLDMVDAEVELHEHFFSKKETAEYFDLLLNNINWQQDKIKFYGKEVLIPRLQAWYGDGDKPYAYSGIEMQPHPWTPELLAIKKKIETVAQVKFTSVLLNLYRHGKDSMSWHADDEKELGQNPVIASVTFGEERAFHFKHKADKNLKEKILLTDGSLLVMGGATQHHWKHQIPKTTRELQPRINLTFRVIKKF